MEFPPQLNSKIFINAANKMIEWRDANEINGEIMSDGTYTAHCCLRAISEVCIENYIMHYHRCYFSYLFRPEKVGKTAPWFKNNYEARILSLLLAAQTIE